MATYEFRLPVNIKVTVETRSSRLRPQFKATVTDDAGDVLGHGEDWSEPGAVGLAVLAARDAFKTCNGCGLTFYRDELVRDVGGIWYCNECAWDRMIPE